MTGETNEQGCEQGCEQGYEQGCCNADSLDSLTPVEHECRGEHGEEGDELQGHGLLEVATSNGPIEQHH